MPSAQNDLLTLLRDRFDGVDNRLDEIRQDAKVRDKRIEDLHIMNEAENVAIKQEIGILKTKIDRAETVGRWGFAFLVTLGGLITWLLGVWQKASAILRS